MVKKIEWINVPYSSEDEARKNRFYMPFDPLRAIDKTYISGGEEKEALLAKFDTGSIKLLTSSNMRLGACECCGDGWNPWPKQIAYLDAEQLNALVSSGLASLQWDEVTSGEPGIIKSLGVTFHDNKE